MTSYELIKALLENNTKRSSDLQLRLVLDERNLLQSVKAGVKGNMMTIWCLCR